MLHAHQPYVVHHGTWPHGLEWLLEAAAETYLPLLDLAQRLLADGIRLQANVSLSPVLLEQLAHPDFRAELPRYLQRKIAAAQEDGAFFSQAGELHLLSLAQHWERVFTRAADILACLDGDLVAGFRRAQESGTLHLLTSAATHGYAPLLGTDESLRGQFQTAVETHRRHLGQAPLGAWLPECGYRPAGPWRFPVPPESGAAAPEQRVGVEQVLAEAGLRFTFADSHMIGDADSPDGVPGPNRTLYRPHTIAGSDVAVFARDPRSAFQVWSAQFGYPGDFAYLDFYKKRWPGGHRYWRVTDAGTGMPDKQPYDHAVAAERSVTHAHHFVTLLTETLRTNAGTDDAPPILCAPFDLELFGHWWHEGMLFLEHVSRILAADGGSVQPIGCRDYLQLHGTAGSLHLPEGSWGAGGDSSVWLNGETAPLLGRMYAAELAVQQASQHAAWTDGAAGERIARQMCRELLLLEASDWPTLITTGAARDYAERRFEEHAVSFATLVGLWQRQLRNDLADEELTGAIAPIEAKDDLFIHVQPAHWRRSHTQSQQRLR
ncbi:MAG: 1,4-alpha-glucan branching protein domain-containing protein [Janthinobacterium lividum]